MLNKTEEDLVAKLGRMIDATAQPITHHEPLQGAISHVRATAHEARQALRDNAQDVAQDAQENRASALAFELELGKTLAQWAWLRDETRRQWLGMNPTEREALGVEELQRRERRFVGIFGVSPSDLAAHGEARVMERLRASADLFSKPDASLGIQGAERGFLDALGRCEAAYQEKVAEGLDDAPIQAELRAARRRAEQVAAAMRSLIDATLRIEGSELDVDAFVLRRSSPAPASEPTEPQG
jgi:hypothetical protein